MERNVISGIRSITLGAAAIGIISVVAQAAPITILNPSFEDRNTNYNPWAFRMVTGTDSWTEDTGNVYVEYTGASLGGTQDGLNDVLFDQGAYGKFHQTLTASVDTSKTYELKWLGGTISTGTVQGGYIVRLYAGANVVASLVQNPGDLSVGTLSEKTLNYTPQPADSGLFKIEVERLGLSGPQSGSVNGYVNVDNFRMNETAVPEPASMALLGLGASALVMRRRRMA
ncbi:MAG: PEP-CTERM sorting domain-containing protein [Phycisphaerales bacterium]|nr:PEP-CTERM sorting domain-containing protein [Phycisphaerales bacterium]